MSHSLRFLGFAVAAWVGIRAVSLGMVPGTEALAFDRPPQAKDSPAMAAGTIPPLVPTEFAEPDPVAPPAPPSPLYPAYPYQFAAAAFPYPAAPAPAAYSAAHRRPAPGYALLTDAPGLPYYDSPVPQLDQWPLSRIASASSPGRRRPEPASSVPAPAAFDRLQLSAWAMLRGRPGASSLASNGMLGGSQAGARLSWRFDRRLAASLRASAPVGGVSRGGEVAAGVRYQPFLSIPVALTAERRQGIGRYGGRSAFALFAEGGVWDRPVAARFALDAYLQAGIVGARRRDWFVDGSATLTRPVWRNLSAGAGVWGGAQPGLSRLDAGPRASLRVGRSMRAHLDYRVNLAGNAQPGSGPVLTIAGDF